MTLVTIQVSPLSPSLQTHDTCHHPSITTVSFSTNIWHMSPSKYHHCLLLYKHMTHVTIQVSPLSPSLQTHDTCHHPSITTVSFSTNIWHMSPSKYHHCLLLYKHMTHVTIQVSPQTQTYNCLYCHTAVNWESASIYVWWHRYTWLDCLTRQGITSSVHLSHKTRYHTVCPSVS